MCSRAVMKSLLWPKPTEQLWWMDDVGMSPFPNFTSACLIECLPSWSFPFGASRHCYSAASSPPAFPLGVGCFLDKEFNPVSVGPTPFENPGPGFSKVTMLRCMTIQKSVTSKHQPTLQQGWHLVLLSRFNPLLQVFVRMHPTYRTTKAGQRPHGCNEKPATRLQWALSSSNRWRSNYVLQYHSKLHSNLVQGCHERATCQLSVCRLITDRAPRAHRQDPRNLWTLTSLNDPISSGAGRCQS